MAAIRDITQLGNPVLHAVAREVADPTAADIRELAGDLLATLELSGGVGIAAPQVGDSRRVIVVASRPGTRYPEAPVMEPLVMVNPRLLSASDSLVDGWEGCLSVPGLRGRVSRHQAVRIAYQDLGGRFHEAGLEDFPARVFQHELDHLDGLVFLDRAGGSRRLATEREYQGLAVV